MKSTTDPATTPAAETKAKGLLDWPIGRIIVTVFLAAFQFNSAMTLKGNTMGFCVTIAVLLLLAVAIWSFRWWGVIPTWEFKFRGVEGFIAIVIWLIAVKLTIAFFGITLAIVFFLWAPSKPADEYYQHLSQRSKWIMLGSLLLLLIVVLPIEDVLKEFARAFDAENRR